MQSQAHNIIFGVDIVKGSSRSREAPRYALVILNGEVERYPSVSLFKLLRMIRQYRPDMLALDSIQELAPNRKELIAFLKRLPPEVRLVQVTGNEHQEPLTKLGTEKGITFNPMMPEEEAFACACLAAMNVGYVVSVFEDRTIIKVSRARSPGRGGWSQNRYRRKIQGKVREKVREIEQKLRDTDYEARLTEGFGGLVNGTFVVNSKRSELGIHNSREEDVQVSVTSVEKDKIEFIPLERKGREHIIVGVDPGTTIGIAALNLDGDLVGLVSSRVMSVPDIVSYIREKGKPVVVATDVVPPPATVEKIKRSFKATLFAPNERISVDEKVKLARPYGYGNDHERDALAAAVKAYNAYKNKFAQIDRKAPAHMTNDVKAMAVGGKTIDAAIEMLRPRPGPRKAPVAPPRPREAEIEAGLAELREQLRRKDEQIRNLQSYVSDLKRDMRQMERRMEWQNKTIGDLQQRGLDDVRKGKEVTIRDREITRLKKEVYDERKRNTDLRSNIDRLKQIRVLEFRGDKSPVKIVENLSRDAIAACDRKLGLKPGDIVFVREAGGGPQAASMLIEKGIRVVIRGTYMSHLAEEKFQEAKVPVVSKEDVSLKIVDDFAVIDPKKLDAAIGRWNDLMALNEKQKNVEWFQGIIDDYKSERRREFRNSTKAQSNDK
jgi:predicted RNase H-like nuclease (RuvC/YqgF family)